MADALLSSTEIRLSSTTVRLSATVVGVDGPAYLNATLTILPGNATRRGMVLAWLAGNPNLLRVDLTDDAGEAVSGATVSVALLDRPGGEEVWSGELTETATAGRYERQVLPAAAVVELQRGYDLQLTASYLGTPYADVERVLVTERSDAA